MSETLSAQWTRSAIRRSPLKADRFTSIVNEISVLQVHLVTCRTNAGLLVFIVYEISGFESLGFLCFDLLMPFRVRKSRIALAKMVVRDIGIDPFLGKHFHVLFRTSVWKPASVNNLVFSKMLSGPPMDRNSSFVFSIIDSSRCCS